MDNPPTKKLLTFVVASLLTAAVYFLLMLVIDRERSLQSLIPSALIFGVVMQLFNLVVYRHKSSGKSLVLPYLMLAIGFAGLALCVWLGWFYDQKLEGSDRLWLIVLLAPPIYLLVTGGRMLWRQRAQGNASSRDQL